MKVERCGMRKRGGERILNEMTQDGNTYHLVDIYSV